MAVTLSDETEHYMPIFQLTLDLILGLM